MPRLTQTEQEEFLNTPGVLLRIACIKPNQHPMIVPIWFIYHDGAICFTPRAQSEWFHCIKQNPNVALSIDEQNLPYRKIIIEGAAHLIHDLGEDDKWRDLYRQIACRYIPGDNAEAYVQDTIDQQRALYKLRLDESEVKSWRMPTEGEPQSGIWHQRYYATGTKLST